MDETSQHDQAQPNQTGGQTPPPPQGNPQDGQGQTNNQHHEAHKPLPPKLPAYSGLPQIENWMEEYLGRRAPQLPQHWREVIAKISPWITLVVLILTIPALLALFGFGFAIMAAAGVAVHFGAWGWFIWVLTLGSLVLEVIALPGLFKRSRSGWIFVFYASLLSLVISILSISIGGVIGGIIGLYFIFQIKNQYK